MIDPGNSVELADSDDGETIDPRELLESLRWHADQIVTNPFGERVWLKLIAPGKGITDCCPADAPCPYHARLTVQASGARQ